MHPSLPSLAPHELPCRKVRVGVWLHRRLSSLLAFTLFSVVGGEILAQSDPFVPVTVAPLPDSREQLERLFPDIRLADSRPEYPTVEPLPAPTASADIAPWSEFGTYNEFEGGFIEQGDEFEVAGPKPKRARISFRTRLYSALTEALCSCDECYQPEWHLIESASFWVDSARPQSRTRLRWDYGSNLIFPDRAEYFWARVGARGPAAAAGSLNVDSTDYHELSLYTETAHENFSAFFVTPYRSLYMDDAGHSAGFGDLQIGTKSLLHDTPLLQVALQMTTTIPSANSRKGLGTGHVSLEPALLIGLSLTQRDFLQVQLAEWIPLGGDPDYQGALLRWGVAWNRIAWQRDRDNVLTLNLDLVGWSFQDGAYTDGVLGQSRANDETYLYLGPGSRWLVCGKFELGFGAIFAVSDNHFAENVLRSDFTMRY